MSARPITVRLKRWSQSEMPCRRFPLPKYCESKALLLSFDWHCEEALRDEEERAERRHKTTVFLRDRIGPWLG